MIRPLLRLLPWLSLLILLSGCDSNGNTTSGAYSQSELTLQAPTVLRSARALSVSDLMVEAIVSYEVNGETVVLTQTAEVRGEGESLSWYLNFSVLNGVTVDLTLTWYESRIQRLDLIRLSRRISTSDLGNTRLSFAFDSNAQYSNDESASDYAGFDFDQDSNSNLNELLSDSDPFTATDPTENLSPILSNVTSSLDLSAALTETQSGEITFSNSGGSALNYTVASSSSWLTVSPLAGSTPAGAETTVNVTASCPGESDEVFLSGLVSINSDGGNASVPVTLDCVGVGGPVLSSVTASVSQTIQVGQSATTAVSFTNSGFGEPLEYTATSSQPWIALDPTTGLLSRAETAQLNVTLSCSSEPESRSAEITLTTNGGNATIPVTLECTAAPTPVLTVANTQINVTAASDANASDTVGFSNTGTAALSFTATTQDSWIELTGASGTLATGEQGSFSLEASCEAFIGVRTGEIAIQSNGGDAVVAVSLDCRGGQLGTVTPTTLAMTAEVGQSDQANLVIANSGNESLEVTVSSDTDWLCADDSNTGSCTSGQSFSTSIAASGFYSLNITALCSSIEETRTGVLSVASIGGDASIPASISCISTAPTVTSVVFDTSGGADVIIFGRPTNVEVSGTNLSSANVLQIEGGTCDVESASATTIVASCRVLDPSFRDFGAEFSVLSDQGSPIPLTPVSVYVQPTGYDELQSVTPLSVDAGVTTEFTLTGIFQSSITMTVNGSESSVNCEVLNDGLLEVVALCTIPSTDFDQLSVLGDGTVINGAPVQLTVTDNNTGSSPVTISGTQETREQLSILWSDVSNADYYELHQRNSAGQFELVGGAISNGVEQANVALKPLYLGALSTDFFVRSCNQFGCADSEIVPYTQSNADASTLSYDPANSIYYDFANAGATIAVGEGEWQSFLEPGRIDLYAANGTFGHGNYQTSIWDPGPDGQIRIGATATHPGAEEYDGFGWSFAISESGDTLVVGAPNEDSASTGVSTQISIDDGSVNSGAAYVYSRQGGQWAFEAYLKPEIAGALVSYGFEVTISDDGNLIAVSAPYSGGEGRPGTVYVYERLSSGWFLLDVLFLSRSEPFDFFGQSIALSGDGSTLAVGAPGESSGAGTVYLFTIDVEGVFLSDTLFSPNADSGDTFGSSLAINQNGDRLAVGAPNEASAATGLNGDTADNSKPNAGAVYLFDRAGSWQFSDYLKASNSDEGDSFGRGLSFDASGDVLAAGGYYEQSVATGIGGDQSDNSAEQYAGPGAVYVFVNSSGSWNQTGYVKPEAEGLQQRFGFNIPELSSDGNLLGIGGIDTGHLY